MKKDTAGKAAALRRATQLGCFGLHQHNGKWMPCKTHAEMLERQKKEPKKEYEQLGERGVVSIDTISAGLVSGVVGGKTYPTLIRKKSLHEEISDKGLGRTIRSARFDPNARDGDGDLLVQDNTPFQRPATPSIAPKPAAQRSPKPKSYGPKKLQQNLAKDPGWFEEYPAAIRKAAPPEVIREYQALARGERVLRSQRVGSGGKEAVNKIISDIKPEHLNKPPGERTLYYVGGTTGSGKSSLVENGTLEVPTPAAAAFIDPDWIKTQLHGYDNGQGSGLVHPESRKLVWDAMDAATAAGADMVIVTLGKRHKQVRKAREDGYQTVGHYVWVPPHVAEARTMARNARNKAQGGQVVPEHLPAAMATRMQQEVPRMITSDLFDEFYLWNNSVQPPSLIAKKTKDGAAQIFDDAAFDDFFGKVGAKYVRRHWKTNTNT